MASSDEAKVKLSADVSSFNSAITSAKSSITELNSELRLIQTQMTTSGTSTDQLQQKMTTLQEKAKALATEEEALKGKLDATKSVYGENSTEAQKLQTQLNNVQTQEEKVAQEIDKTNEAIKQQQQAEEQSQTASSQLVSTINQQEQELADLKTQYTNVVLEEGKDSEAAQELAGQITTLNGDLQENKAKLADAEQAADDLTKSEEELGDQAEETGEQGADGFQAMYDALVAAGLIEAVKKLVDAMKECVSVAADFEAQMSTVEALSGATSSEMDQLTAAAKEMGETTKFTATESAEALEYMALAGWSTDEMLDGLSGVINLAAAAGEDLASTSDIVTDALTAFGMSASDSAHFSDVLAAASTNSNTTVSQMGEAFKQVATTAGTLGYSIDDVSVALGLMADNGLKGSSAGTALSTALTRMSGANASATKQLDALNVSMYNADGSTKDLATFLGELRTSLNENCTSSEDMQVALYNLAGQKGMKGLAAIVNTTDEDFDSLTEAIAECDGCAEEMAEVRMDNFEGSVTLLNSAFDALKTTLGEAALPALTGIVDVFTNLISSVSEFLSEHEMLAKAIDAFCVALVVATAALVAMAVAVSDLRTKFAQLTAEMAANPFGLLMVAISGVIAGVVSFIAMMQDTEDEQDRLRKSIAETTKEIKDQEKAYEETKSENEEAAKSYKSLVDELDDLCNNTNRTAAKQSRMESVIDQLNDVLGEGTIVYDEHKDAINLTTEEIDDLVDALIAETEQEAAMTNQDELYSKRQEAVEALTEAQENYSEKLAELEAIENDATMSERDQAQAWQDCAAELALMDDEVTDATNNLAMIDAQIEETDSSINEMASGTEDLSNTLEGKVQMAIEDMVYGLEELDEAYQEAYQSAYDSISGQFDLWDQAPEVVTMSVEDMKAAIDSQVEYWNEYQENIDALLNSGIEGMEEYLGSFDTTSTEGVAYIASLRAGLDTDFEGIEEIVKEGTSVLPESWDSAASQTADVMTGYTEQVTQTIDEMIQSFDSFGDIDLTEYGVSIMETLMFGLDEETGEVTDASRQISDQIIEIWQDESTAAQAKQAGEEIGKALPEGILEASTEVGTATSQIVQAAQEEFASSEGTEAAKSSGTEMGQGYAEGITSSEGEVTSAAQSVGDSGTNAFEMATNASITQPLGMNFVQGAVQGVNGMASSFVNATGQTATQGVNKFKSTLGVSSPSTIANSAGSDFIQGGINGVNAKKGSFESATRSAAQSGVSAFKNVCNSSALYGAGSDAIQGAINGANAKGTAFSSTMSSIASSAMASFKASLGTASPSWIAEEAAEYVDEGAIIGAENKAGDLIKAFGNVGAGAMDAFQDSLNADSALQATVNGDGIISVYDQLSSKLNGIATDIEISNAFDYDKLAAAMARQNIVVKYNDRELGRAVREVM